MSDHVRKCPKMSDFSDLEKRTQFPSPVPRASGLCLVRRSLVRGTGTVSGEGELNKQTQFCSNPLCGRELAVSKANVNLRDLRRALVAVLVAELCRRQTGLAA